MTRGQIWSSISPTFLEYKLIQDWGQLPNEKAHKKVLDLLRHYHYCQTSPTPPHLAKVNICQYFVLEISKNRTINPNKVKY